MHSIPQTAADLRHTSLEEGLSMWPKDHDRLTLVSSWKGKSMLRYAQRCRGARRPVLIAVLALVVALGTVVVAPVAAVGSADTPAIDTAHVDTSDVFGEPLESFLAHYPDARQAADGSYELESGLHLVPPAPTADFGITEYPSGCPGESFCMWQHDNFKGWRIDDLNTDCRWRTLDSAYRNRISSMHNTHNSYTAFWADIDPNPDVRDALGPNKHRRNLKDNTAPDGGHWGDRIDAFDPTNRC
jgi:hypothetical protein